MKKILLADVEQDLEVLRDRSEAISVVDEATKQLVKDMFEAMKKDNGIGLSAPQVGELKRIIIAEYDNDRDPVPRTVLINPEVTWTSKKEELDEEGCLSFPEIYGMVRRPEKIRYRGLDENGQIVEGKASGLQARVIQHEIDHLDGILLPDRVEGDLYKYVKQDDTEKL